MGNVVMTTPMIGRVLVLWSAVSGLQVAPAFGQGQDVRHMKLQAQENCLSGNTDAGVALLAKLYALSGQPNYIYNQGRCYEQASRPEDAINKFREYLRVARDAPPAERADAEKHIEECRALKAEQERERREATAEAAKGQTDPAAPEPHSPASLSPRHEPAEQGPVALDVSAQPKSESPPVYARWWFWTGIAAVVGGAVTAYLLATRSVYQSACASESYPCATIK